MNDKKKVTIKDIARQTGLSIATISRVVNKTDKHYSKKTEDLVNKAIKKLNYRPNFIAWGLKKKKTNTIGFVVPELDSYYTEVFLGAQDTALKYKYSNFLCNTNYIKELEKLYIDNLLDRQVDGVIFNTGLLNNKLVHKFLDENIPVALVENFINDPAIIKNPLIITISLDFYKYAKMAVEHLIKKGYRKIAYISAPLEMISLRERLRGYKDALAENNISFDEKLVYFDRSIRGEWDLSASRILVESIMSKPEHPDALFIISDTVAMVAIQVIKSLGFKIPDDVGVMGFDDRRVCKYLDPPLTSIYQPKYEMGATATELLIRIIEGEEIKEKNIYMEMKLSIRESSNR